MGYILEIQKQVSGFGRNDATKMVTDEKKVFKGWAKIFVLFNLLTVAINLLCY